MKFRLLLSILFLSALHVSAQFAQGLFTIGGTQEDEGNSIIQTRDSGFAIAGFTKSYGVDSEDVYIVKLDSKGNKTWTKTIGVDGNEWASAIIQTNDGGYAILGSTNSIGGGDYDIFVIKMDSTGTVTWSKTLGGSDDDYGVSILQLKNGDYIVGGNVNSFDFHNGAAYLAKLDNSGAIIWTQTYPKDVGINLNSLIQTKDGGYAITGGVNIITINPDAYMLKLDSAGNIVWTTTIGGYGEDYGESIIQTQDNGYAVAGYTISFGNQGDFYVIKLDSTGMVSWTKTVGTTTNYEFAQSIVQNPDGNYVVAGQTILPLGSGYRQAVYLTELDNTGSFLWGKTYNDSDNYNYSALVRTFDGGYAITGEGYSRGDSSYDVFLMKTDANGVFCDSSINEGKVNFSDSGTVSNLGNSTIADSGRINDFVPKYDTGGNYTSICFQAVSGINKINPPNSSVIVYPNPSNGLFTLATQGVNETTQLQVYNILGEKIYTALIESNSTYLDLTNQTTGIYLYRLLKQNGNIIATGKLVVE